MNTLIPEHEEIRLKRARNDCRELHGIRPTVDEHLAGAIIALRKFDLEPTSRRVAHVLDVHWSESFDRRFDIVLGTLAANGRASGLDDAVHRAAFDKIQYVFGPYFEQLYAEQIRAIELRKAAADASLREAESARDKAAHLLTENESLVARLFVGLDRAVELFQTFARQGVDGAQALGARVGFVSATESQFAQSQEDNRRGFLAALRKLRDRYAAVRHEAEKHRLVARERERLVVQLQQECRKLGCMLNEARSSIAELQGAEKRARDGLVAKEAELKRALSRSLRRDLRLEASLSALAVAKAEADQLREQVSHLEARIAHNEAERGGLMRQLEQLHQAVLALRQRRPKT